MNNPAVKNSRSEGRAPFQLRSVSFETNVNPYAEGSCLAKFGQTHVLCTASVDEKVPPWLRHQNQKSKSKQGWVTAEYGMLPRSTHTRMDREAAKGKQSSRSVEISRLIGRSLRSVVDLNALGERTIWLDCDVIQADGGTRTAAISGAYVALHLAIQKLFQERKLELLPLNNQVAAISCGIDGTDTALLDLDYAEDSNAIADANFVMTSELSLIEVQCTAEQRPISDAQFKTLHNLARQGIEAVVQAQNTAIQQG